ncbi:bifunctional glutamate N-acetyltransferase/amino-acid acetyltransferase ArgJ [Nitrosococcus watsonii]|uniref:Arginine biosynthesis bifunctional protein ArgJ n=1 Tax=Nitrosococcus watsoni (strain C-113) TaxID=105559 RepID=D8K8Z8_NITWC|nr:bifunctional glutamate N-acetyltransferase/amino-acid acetyltransferase ArgJ [Nitrosococcus watsonii]ADJ27208.1 arginine biosynthesis bifunctional protein ArgJ [Nitrosococcus watsonii C-113]
MAAGLEHLQALLPVAGVELGAMAAGIRYRDRPDLAIITVTEGSTCAAVFTRNVFCAAPVIVARRHLAGNSPRFLLINAGNANAGTGIQGIVDAETCCATLAELGGVASTAVLPFSTGVIGERLPVSHIQAVLPQAWQACSSTGWLAAAHAIMTTDTTPKGTSVHFIYQGHPVTVTGIAKGSGMIRPDMATMLAFLATDARVSKEVLQRCLARGVAESFNRITVDGDTSTNDACVLLATGQSEVSIATVEDPAFAALQQAVSEVCLSLAQAIVRDGEGATKFITIEVTGGRNIQECEQVAYTIAQSPLVKTACFASDPNWGRILAAIGRSGVPDLEIRGVSLYLGEVCVIHRGVPHPEYTEEQGRTVMAQDDITLKVELGRGDSRVQIWTCDLSFAYVKINAEYRS